LACVVDLVIFFGARSGKPAIGVDASAFSRFVEHGAYSPAATRFNCHCAHFI
jgi:hypothetical protein